MVITASWFLLTCGAVGAVFALELLADALIARYRDKQLRRELDHELNVRFPRRVSSSTQR